MCMQSEFWREVLYVDRLELRNLQSDMQAYVVACCVGKGLQGTHGALYCSRTYVAATAAYGWPLPAIMNALLLIAS